MGYTTEFEGSFELDRPLTNEQRTYLLRFSETRRMKRSPKIASLPDPVRESVNLPIGEEGAYYVGEETSGIGVGIFSMGSHVADHNVPPGQLGMEEVMKGNSNFMLENRRRIEEGLCQPGLWCQWIPNHEGTAIVWDQGEKFYYYTAWVKYLIAHFLGPWGYKLNGVVKYQGEGEDDKGVVVIVDNHVEKKPEQKEEEGGDKDDSKEDKEASKNANSGTVNEVEKQEAEKSSNDEADKGVIVDNHVEKKPEKKQEEKVNKDDSKEYKEASKNANDGTENEVEKQEAEKSNKDEADKGVIVDNHVEKKPEKKQEEGGDKDDSKEYKEASKNANDGTENEVEKQAPAQKNAPKKAAAKKAPNAAKKAPAPKKPVSKKAARKKAPAASISTIATRSSCKRTRSATKAARSSSSGGPGVSRPTKRARRGTK